MLIGMELKKEKKKKDNRLFCEEDVCRLDCAIALFLLT